jgi:hypothetical protein
VIAIIEVDSSSEVTDGFLEVSRCKRGVPLCLHEHMSIVRMKPYHKKCGRNALFEMSWTTRQQSGTQYAANG